MSRPLDRIPATEAPKLIGQKVHLAWADAGCVWRLVEIRESRCLVETPRTRRRRWVDLADLCYLRRGEAMRAAKARRS